MRNFKTFIETLKNPNSIRADDAPTREKIWKKTLKLLPDANIFVLKGERKNITEGHIHPTYNFSLPFPTCFFEKIIIDENGTEVFVAMQSPKEEFNGAQIYLTGTLLAYVESDNGEVNALGLSRLHSILPNSKTVLTWLEPYVVHDEFLNNSSMGEVIKGELQIIGDFLSDQEKYISGVEHTRQRIKIGSGALKDTHTIRKIIRIMPRAERKTSRPMFSREIDWSHRWQVRGHWRKTNSVGKNFSGEYAEYGRTWVNSFEKGPDDKPLIKKMRLYETPAPG